MPRCKICGKPVSSATVIHGECLEQLISGVKCEMCDNFCRWPHEARTQEELDAICKHCPLDLLDEIGE